MKDLPPDSVIRAVYSFPAFDDTERNAIQAKRFEKHRATHGTPYLLVRPMKRGAFPFLDMNNIVLDATYSELLPAEMTETTINPLIRWAAGRIPASSKAIVRGEDAVEDPVASSFLESYGIRMPMKNIIPMTTLEVALQERVNVVGYEYNSPT